MLRLKVESIHSAHGAAIIHDAGAGAGVAGVVASGFFWVNCCRISENLGAPVPPSRSLTLAWKSAFLGLLGKPSFPSGMNASSAFNTGRLAASTIARLMLLALRSRRRLSASAHSSGSLAFAASALVLAASAVSLLMAFR